MGRMFATLVLLTKDFSLSALVEKPRAALELVRDGPVGKALVGSTAQVWSLRKSVAHSPGG